MLATPAARDFVELVYYKLDDIDDFYAMRRVCRMWREVSHRITPQWRRVFKKFRRNMLKTVPMYKQALQAAAAYQLHRQTLVFNALLKSKEDLERRHKNVRERIEQNAYDVRELTAAKARYDHERTKRARIDLT